MSGIKTLFVISLLACSTGFAQKNELALSIGRSKDTKVAPVGLESGVAYQVNYGRRLAGGTPAALYGEVHFLASPLRNVTGGIPTSTHDVASLYVLPGLRLKLFPEARLSPFGVVGAGWALYEQSDLRNDGGKNGAPRTLSHGAIDYGFGVDLRVVNFLAFRGELRDSYTGSPSFNIASVRGGQHNVVSSIGFVLRWH